MQTFSRGQHCWGSMHTAQHCSATLRRSQNNGNVGTCCVKSLTGFQLNATSAYKCQHCCGSMQTDATSLNIAGPNNVACCWLTKLCPFAWGLTQQRTIHIQLLKHFGSHTCSLRPNVVRLAGALRTKWGSKGSTFTPKDSPSFRRAVYLLLS